MMIDFYEAFGNNADEDKSIPQEVLDELNKGLPGNLVYYQDENGRFRVVPKPDREDRRMRMTTQFDLDPEKDDLLINRLKIVPREKWTEYFYRAQKSVAVKNIKIGDDEQLIPIEQTVANPLTEEQITMRDCSMIPEKFPDATPMAFESEQGDRAVIHFQQQAYDSLSEIKFSNVDFPALKIDLYVYDPLVETPDENSKTNKDNKVSVTYSVTPTKAHSVSDAITALHIFKGLFEGTTKVNGEVMTSTSAQAQFDPKRIEDAMAFWTTAFKLEERLKVKFDPAADFPMEDVKFFYELDTCLNKKKQIVWKHPVDHFHINGYHPQVEESTMNAAVGKEKLYFRFIEGPIPCTLLGAEFDIYSFSEMTDLVMTNIEWDDEEKQNGEIYVADAPGKVWKLKRLYMTKEDAEKYGRNNVNNYEKHC